MGHYLQQNTFIDGFVKRSKKTSVSNPNKQQLGNVAADGRTS